MWISFLVFIGILGFIGSWQAQMRAREYALELAKNSCKASNAQLLDETVSLHQIRLKRNKAGKICLQREYRFDYTLDGKTRCRGRVLLLGKKEILSKLEAIPSQASDTRFTPIQAKILPFRPQKGPVNESGKSE